MFRLSLFCSARLFRQFFFHSFLLPVSNKLYPLSADYIGKKCGPEFSEFIFLIFRNSTWRFVVVSWRSSLIIFGRPFTVIDRYLTSKKRNIFSVFPVAVSSSPTYLSLPGWNVRKAKEKRKKCHVIFFWFLGISRGFHWGLSISSS